MAEKFALAAGKRFLNKKLGKTSTVDESPDPYKYVSGKDRHGKKKLAKKNENYFHERLGIPKHDARVLTKVMHRAQKIDGKQRGPVRFGVSAAVQLIPEVGDVVDGLLSMWIIKSAGKVSGGLDPGYRKKMVRNVITEVAVGSLPYLGDLIDMFFQANTRNFVVLEAMLLARVEAERTLRTEKVDNGPIRDHDHAHANGHTKHNARIAGPQEYDDRHAGVHKRLLTNGNQGSKKPTHASESRNGGSSGWMNKFQSRGKSNAPAQDAAPSLPQRPAQNGGHGRLSDEETAPARPPRPAAARHQVGSF